MEKPVIRKDCEFYKEDKLYTGCKALKKLYCAREIKPCKFFKEKGKEKLKGVK